ncbi:hypothetical protein K438DRAFT_1139403 [Mycena galopus ATCC 62051]|nr:hypothetical protein K438DRAFT_1139403 [Mycena galopus ATCC 62051]
MLIIQTQEQQQHPAPHHRPNGPQTGPRAQQQHQNAMHTASASLETVERTLGDLRVSNAAAAGANRRQRPKCTSADSGGVHVGPAGGVAVSAMDFDFATMNAKFNKVAPAARSQRLRGPVTRMRPPIGARAHIWPCTRYSAHGVH